MSGPYIPAEKMSFHIYRHSTLLRYARRTIPTSAARHEIASKPIAVFPSRCLHGQLRGALSAPLLVPSRRRQVLEHHHCNRLQMSTSTQGANLAVVATEDPEIDECTQLLYKIQKEKERDEERRRQRVAAFHGEELPQDLGGTTENCIIHGIRHHERFAKSPEVTKLCSEEGKDRYARARNARLIMSNTVPEMGTDAVKPYCIWHPDLATEETYRELSRRYPDMRYQVGRACAIAGYNRLYDELDLLPDVSIAAEAWDSDNPALFEAITNQAVRYAVMDDHTRTVNLENPRAGACLNGDTAVRSTLQIRRINPKIIQETLSPGDEDYNYFEIQETLYVEADDHWFDIQEDRHVDTSGRRPVSEKSASQLADLICKPLPRDLLTTEKDVLILMATWDGNIDRYSRLRRPKPIANEVSAVVRGAYHHTSFARWLDSCAGEIFPNYYDEDAVRKAVHARFIMNNDLSRINSNTDSATLPELFWWPHWPHQDTLQELARRRPDMKHYIILACIAANYRGLFDELQHGIKPSEEQWEAAIQSPNRYYREHVKRRFAEEGIEEGCFMDLESYTSGGWPHEEGWTNKYMQPTKEQVLCERIVRMPTYLLNMPDDDNWDSWDPPESLLSSHMHEQVAEWNLFLSATDEARKASREERGH